MMKKVSVNLIDKGLAKFLMLLVLVAAVAAPQLLRAQVTPTPQIKGSIYGGGRMANVGGNAKVQMNNGTVGTSDTSAAIYGGNDISGNTGNGANSGAAGTDYGVIISGGTINGNVFGGANGYYACHGEENASTIYYTGTTNFVEGIDVTTSTTAIPSISKTYVKVNGGVIKGSVYGGGNLAPVSNGSEKNGEVKVDIFQGTIEGSVYTGGNMASVYAGSTDPLLTVNNSNSSSGYYDLFISGGVYGGNDKSGTIVSSATGFKTSVTIAGAPSIGDVFGGGNGAYDYTQAPLNICGGMSKPDQTAGTLVTINTEGGYINRVFGGGNSATVGTPQVVFEAGTDDAGSNEHAGNHVGQIFGGNNSVELAAVPEITLTRGQVDEVYGGGNAGAITANNGTAMVVTTDDYTGLSTKILMTSTEHVKVGTLYGGCNQADVAGGTLINMASSTATVGTIYGACNISGDMAGTAHVLVSNGSVTGSVFGGANGYYGCPQRNGSNEYVYQGDWDDSDGVEVAANQKMPTVTRTDVKISNGTITGSVYAGGNLAPLGNYTTKDGVANLTITGGTIAKAYGGGNMADVNGYTNVLVSGGTLTDLFGGNDKSGAITGSSAASRTASDESEVKTASYVKITNNPEIARVFGGGNGDYYELGTNTYKPDASHADCITSLPSINSTFVDLHMNASTHKIDEAYAGGNNASVSGTGANATILLNETAADVAAVSKIFGGNNQAEMNIVPSVTLLKGTVEYVYGGGNAGAMTGSKETMVDGQDQAVGTLVMVDKSDVNVTKALYGGCNQANVSNPTYVQVSNGTVNQLFGGNDKSGTVAKTYVRVNGGTVAEVFGGSNGNYEASVYATVSRPTVTNTDVKITAGAITDVFGGGYAGDCFNTMLVIDGTATFAGDVFGGGKGALSPTSADRVGNVTGTSTTELHKAGALTKAQVYGGGKAGNVANTEMTVFKTWNQNLGYLYGGCQAADISGTAKTLVEKPTNGYTINTLYGGNDVAGTVATTEVTIEGGKFGTLFGGGNGKYTYDATDGYTGFSLPISENISVTINDGNFSDNVYGGGDLGLAGKTAVINAVKTSTDFYDTDPDAYGRILLTIHGGNFSNHLFAGGRGESAKGQVVYGLKQLNMDGGVVGRSVYGGSESVNDGYPGENKINTVTDEVTDYTLRPSSIINIVGGEVQNNVYGGGFLGTIYGSVYINIGQKAVENCEVWSKLYGRNSHPSDVPETYANYKPNFDAAHGSVDMKANLLTLWKSIFSGSDYGDAVGQADFTQRGFVGGETHLVVNGEGYNTQFYNTSHQDLPGMDISGSLYGSGTSCEGGDQGRYIDVLNYGEYFCNSNLPSTSKELGSIQRADKVIIGNSFIKLLGAQDNSSAYVSSSYSLSRIKDLTTKGDNFLALAAPTLYIGKVNFKEATTDDPTTRQALYGATYGDGTNQCAGANICDMMPEHFTKIYVEDGVFFDIYGEEKVDNQVYGAVNGYAYLMAATNTQAYVTARLKTTSKNSADGGFFNVCKGMNTMDSANTGYKEFPYINYVSDYRTWTFGDLNGGRKRQVTIVAHSDLTKLANNYALPAGDQKKYDNTTSACENDVCPFAVSTGRLELPPTKEGHYYNITGINVDLSNGGQLILNEQAFKPTFNASGALTGGSWQTTSSCVQSTSRDQILEQPTYNFGLMFELDSKTFNATEGVYSGGNHAQKQCIVFGNNKYDALNGYYSTRVDDQEPDPVSQNVIPKIDFYLTYSTLFPSTILRDVIFYMMEYDENGQEVGKIDVTVTISTVTNDFRSESFNMLAMYNEGLSNQYTHKVLLPASLTKRDLYLTKIQYQNMQTPDGDQYYFNLKDTLDTKKVEEFTSKEFGLSFELSEDLTSTVNSSLGWYEMKTPKFDLHDVAKAIKGETLNEHDAYGSATSPAISTKGSDNPAKGLYDKGLYLGVLDGRSPAAVNMSLLYNGNEIFKDFTENHGYVATVTLTFDFYEDGNATHKGSFDWVCNIRTRKAGDTIYIASADKLEYSDYPTTGETTTLYAWDSEDPSAPVITEDQGVKYRFDARYTEGKAPCTYVRSFKRATHPDVYQEGDVFCILDTVKMGQDENVVIRGGEYGMLQVIRYTGRHENLKGVKYTGSMISMTSNSRLSCYNMRFDGGGICKTWSENTDLRTSSSYNIDPNITLDETDPDHVNYMKDQRHRIYSYTLSKAPIFDVKDGATLTLADKVEVIHNFNENTTLMDASNHFQGAGAIAVHKTTAATPMLNLNNNITIKENGVLENSNHTLSMNQGAGIFIDRGLVNVGDYASGAVIDVEDNYFASNWSTELVGNATTKYQWNHPNTAQRNNIYLTRTKPTSGTDFDKVMTDDASDYLRFLTLLNTPSRVGITKWFPGGDFESVTTNRNIRDTIRVVRVGTASQLVATRVYERDPAVFFSDSAKYDIFYHGTVDPYNFYLHRCATFSQQEIGAQLYAHTYDAEGNEVFDGNNQPIPIYQKAPLEYLTEEGASCPNVPDILRMNVYGGFYPYTFVLSDKNDPANPKELTVEITPYDNREVSGNANQARRLASNSFDFPLFQNSSLGYMGEQKQDFTYHVSSTDLAGCERHRDVIIRVVKTEEGTYSAGSAFYTEHSSTGDGQYTVPGTSFSTVDANKFSAASEDPALALRLYKGINVRGKVTPDPSWGTITAYLNTTEEANEIKNFTTTVDGHAPENNLFCEGDFIQLWTAPADDNHQFVMWDFNPDLPAGSKTSPNSFFVSSNAIDELNAIYCGKQGEITHWSQAVTSKPSGYTTAYNGHVTITTKEGLAWLISVVNGLNGQTARAFLFDTVTVQGSGEWDMNNYLWTPIGSPNNPFRGRFEVDGDLTIKGLTVNDPTHPNVGFFGNVDTARIENVKLKGVFISGSQYGAPLVAVAKNSLIKNCVVGGDDDNSVVSADYTVAGLVAHAIGSTIDGNKVIKARLIGNTIYGAGLLGSIQSYNTLSNNNAENVDMKQLSAVYAGGLSAGVDGCPYEWRDTWSYRTSDGQIIVGVWIDVRDNTVVLKASGEPYGESENPCSGYTPSSKDVSSDLPLESWIANNYVNYTAPMSAVYSGGLAGMASHTHLENNYAYGSSKATMAAGALVGRMDEGVVMNDCFFLDGTANSGVGMGENDNDNSTDNIHPFNGYGKKVTVDSVPGVNNLTRILNRWVRQHGTAQYRTWRSSLTGENNGLPVFGEPDYITVRDTMKVTTCDYYQWNGQQLTESGIYRQYFHDTMEFIDSTMVLMLTINESLLTEFADSASLGSSYEGHGFSVDSAELELLRNTVNEFGSALMVLSDTLSSDHGCDSVVTLHLTVYARNSELIDPVTAYDVKVYPNPTVSHVDVELEGMTQVEVYDNVSRQVMLINAQAGRCSVDLSTLPSGYYYFRIHSDRGVVIKKVVKR